ncbi:MAG: hypothetical protein GY832_31710 [Chloroflexi bacterium]|nr:hypothetical protein [Chloroflexota bacterium]
MRDYRIMVRERKSRKYRPVADILASGLPVWATGGKDTLKWFGLTRQDLAKRKAALAKRFPNLKFSIRTV